jgi:hypothetical protein
MSSHEWTAGDPYFGPDSADTLAGLFSDRGRSLLRDWNLPEAERILRNALTIYEQTQPDDWRRFEVQSLLGAVLTAQHRYTEAEPLIAGGYDGLRDRKAKIETQKWPFVLNEAAQYGVRLYEAWGKSSQADAWKATLETLKLPSDVFAPPAVDAGKAN